MNKDTQKILHHRRDHPHAQNPNSRTLDQEDFVLLGFRLRGLASGPVKDTHSRALGSGGSEWHPLAKTNLSTLVSRGVGLAVIIGLGALEEGDGHAHDGHAEPSSEVEWCGTPVAAIILIALLGGGSIAGRGSRFGAGGGNGLGGNLLALLGLALFDDDVDLSRSLWGLALVPVLDAN